MNWAWPISVDQIWHSLGFPALLAFPTWLTFPMWLTLAAAGFFGIIALITLVRAEKSVANGALTVITLLAIGVAAAATLRGYDQGGRNRGASVQAPPPMSASLPALSCI